MRFFERSRPRRLWLVLSFIAVLVVFAFVIRAAVSSTNQPAALPPPSPTAPDASLPPTVFTYFYYWYDDVTGAHLETEFLTNALPTDPAPSWRNVDWFRKELSDMIEAGIDVVLPVYWGTTEEWSTAGLPNLAQAWQEMKDQGQEPPEIGLFLDTPILKDRDLTTPEGKGYFYEMIREFFVRIPRDQWALVDGRPIVWLFIAVFPEAFNQGTFDFVYKRFEQDFGVRPYIVRELSWDYVSQPIATDATYGWGAAQNGLPQQGTVATIGPGYDESQLPGRAGVVRPRDDGRWYTSNFTKAIASGKRMLAIETWNEIHEASGIGETLEYGRQYIEITREYTDRFRAHAAAWGG